MDPLWLFFGFFCLAAAIFTYLGRRNVVRSFERGSHFGPFWNTPPSSPRAARALFWLVLIGFLGFAIFAFVLGVTGAARNAPNRMSVGVYDAWLWLVAI
ncbi:MAG: hypothetical protein WEB00_03065 [Dehalococcoidia bacterium]